MKPPLKLLLVEAQEPNGDLYTEAFGLSVWGSGVNVGVTITPLEVSIHTPSDHEGFQDFLHWLGGEAKRVFFYHYGAMWDDIETVRFESE